MTRARLAAIAAVVLVASPAFANINPGDYPTAKAKAAPLEGVAPLLVDNQQNTLPLECRGYYLRGPVHRSGPSRCE
jgi:hypothetical protein